MALKKFKRKLTAILSADVKGYSRLMRDDEDATVRTLNRYKETMVILIERHQGRLVDSTGDNLLAEFESVVGAVKSATEIQKVLKIKNTEQPQDRKMEFRIGINVGDVIKDGDRIYGDGVNVAARIESLAEGGGICISRSAYDQVKNRLKLEYEFMGEKSVKNIKEPVPVYRVLSLPGAAAHSVIKAKKSAEKEMMASSYSGKPSIAVLPFVNISGDAEQEYFSDGITEELITSLAKLEGLKVISRTSAFYFKGKDVDLRTIGEKLKVDNVLEGSVRKAGNELRISAQLIKASDDTHLWAETFDRELKDIFSIQKEISTEIVDMLKISLLDKSDRAWLKSPTYNQEAYNLYLKGLFLYNKMNPNYFQKAIDYYKQAVVLDANYALAYDGIASAYHFAGLFSSLPSKEYFLKANEAAMKALEIDPNLVEAYITLGRLKIFYEWDWDGAEKALKRALELTPDSADAHIVYCLYLMAIGRLKEALQSAKQAQNYDPLSVFVNTMLGTNLRFLDQLDLAIETQKNLLEMYPNNPHALQKLAIDFIDKGMFEEGIDIYKKLEEHFPGNPFHLGHLGYGYAMAGQREEAYQIINKLIDRRQRSHFPAFFIADIYAGLGDKDQSFKWLEKAIEEKDTRLFLIKVIPEYEKIRSDPRFSNILAKMGLEQ